jgi:hypothetical protein
MRARFMDDQDKSEDNAHFMMINSKRQRQSQPPVALL